MRHFEHSMGSSMQKSDLRRKSHLSSPNKQGPREHDKDTSSYSSPEYNIGEVVAFIVLVSDFSLEDLMQSVFRGLQSFRVNKKTAHICNEYCWRFPSSSLANVTNFLAALRSTDVAVSDYEFILYAIGGLESDFETIVAVISALMLTMIISTMCSLFLSQEICNTIIRGVTFSIASENLVQGSSKKKNCIICQICKTKGHTALACYNWHNVDSYPTPTKIRLRKRPMRKEQHLKRKSTRSCSWAPGRLIM